MASFEIVRASKLATHRELRDMSAGRLGRRALAILEMALLLSLFLIFWFAICDWGIAYFVHESVVEKATAAVRWAVVNTYDAAKLKNIFLYDDANADGCASTWFSTRSLNPATDIVISRDGVGTRQERVTLTVRGYQWVRFTPFLRGTYVAGPVQVSLPVRDLRKGIGSPAANTATAVW